MKNPSVGEVKKCNQQCKQPNTIVKINGEMKTSEETVMKIPKGFSWKNRKSLNLELKSLISWNVRKFLSVGFSIFRALIITSWNIRIVFFWKKYKSFFRVFISWSIRNFPGVDYFLFFELGLKSAGFHFQKYNKSFLLRKWNFSERFFYRKNIKNFLGKNFEGWGRKVQGFTSGNTEIVLNIRARKFHFLKLYFFSSPGIFFGVDFFVSFFDMGWVVQGSVFKNIRKDFFGENIRKAFLPENIRIFLILEQESFISQNIRNFFRVDVFVSFLGLSWEVQGFISGNVRKAFLWENIRIFLILDQESSISQI